MNDILGMPPLIAPSYEALANLREIERKERVAQFLELREWLKGSLARNERIDFRKLGELILVMSYGLTGDLR